MYFTIFLSPLSISMVLSVKMIVVKIVAMMITAAIILEDIDFVSGCSLDRTTATTLRRPGLCRISLCFVVMNTIIIGTRECKLTGKCIGARNICSMVISMNKGT